MAPPFTIVQFLCDNSTAVVPTKWLNSEEDVCYWPNNGSALKKISKLVSSLEDYNDDWITYEVRILGKAGMSIKILAFTFRRFLNFLI